MDNEGTTLTDQITGDLTFTVREDQIEVINQL